MSSSTWSSSPSSSSSMDHRSTPSNRNPPAAATNRSRSQSRHRTTHRNPQTHARRSHSEAREHPPTSPPATSRHWALPGSVPTLFPSSFLSLRNMSSDKNPKNPLTRLTRLLIEDTKLADIERVGEAVIKEDIANVIESVSSNDPDGDTYMDEQAIVMLQRRNSRTRSHLNPSFQQYSPCTSSPCSGSPSPTKSIQSYSSPTLVPYHVASPLSAGPAAPSRIGYSSPVPHILKRPRASSLSDSSPARSSTTTRSKRARTNGGYDSSDNGSIFTSTPVSPCLLARSSTVYPPRSWMLSGSVNATRQVPQLLNIQGASLAFSKMELDTLDDSHPS